VNGGHTYAEDGPYTISTSITESNGADQDTGSTSSTATVHESVLSQDSPTVSAVEGEPFSGVVAHFSDPGTADLPSEFTATILWGDGSPTTSGTLVSTGGGNFDISGTHTYASHGSFTFSVTTFENNDAGFSITTSNTVTVAEGVSLTVTGPAQITEGGMLVYPVSVHNGGNAAATDVMFSDVLPDDALFSFANFSQGGPFNASGQTVSGDLGTIPAGATVNGTIVAQALEEGFFKNSASINSTSGVTITDENATAFTTVIDAPLTPTNGKPISAKEGRKFTSVVGSFIDADPNGDPSDYTTLINWGDGQTSAGSLVPDGPGFDIVGSHRYAEADTFNVSVAIKDTGGATATANSIAKVAESPLDQAKGLALTKSKGVAFTNLTLGSFRDQDSLNTNPGDYSGKIDWGDGSAKTNAKFVFNGSTLDVGSFWKVQGSHKYSAKKTYTVKITLFDTANPNAKLTITATIKVT
jgi:uncharacterized repeat protein (TIGR01451 family)